MSFSSLAQVVVRVLPDEPGIGKAFDYLVPDGGSVGVGDRVRVALGGRRVGGWVVDVDVAPPDGVALRALAKMSGRGPSPELISLASWAAWRWSGRQASFLRTANPERNVDGLPPVPASDVSRLPFVEGGVSEQALDAGAAVVRVAPATSAYPVVAAAVRRGSSLVVCPTLAQARAVAARLRADGVAVALHPRDWARGAAGATVVGARAAAWAPVGGLAAVVVLDEHDESLQSEAAPTWHARDVAIERARRAGVPCVLVSPCPSLEALGWGRLFTRGRSDERAGWPIVDVVDMREQDPRTGLLTPALTKVLRSDARVVCVLNRTGRARLLACGGCGELARCERCDAAVAQPGDSLDCPRCGESRPVLCLHCGKTRLKALRQGVTRVRDEIEALVGEPVAEVTGAAARGKDVPPPPTERVVVGTEASLHQVGRADVVAFLDVDQELLAPRYRASEQALGLLARAARLVGGRARGGRLLVQTFVPDHEVVQAAVLGDPARVAEAEAERRELLRFPPVSAMAEVSGAAADEFVDAFGTPAGVEVLGPSNGRWLLRAPEHAALCDALAATPRPAGRVRVAVDPLRI